MKWLFSALVLFTVFISTQIFAGGKVCVHNSGDYYIYFCVVNPSSTHSMKCTLPYKEGFRRSLKYKSGQHLLVYSNEQDWQNIFAKKLYGGNQAYYVDGYWAFNSAHAQVHVTHGCNQLR